jgi:Xaa-Pro aminopeptidase
MEVNRIMVASGQNEKKRHHASYVPKLSLQERDRRWSLIRQSMARDGLDCLLFIANDSRFDMGLANMRYVTHIATKHDGFAFFPAQGEPVAWAQSAFQHIPSGSSYLYTQDWVTDIRPSVGVAPVIRFLKQSGYERSTIGLVGMRSAMNIDIIPLSTSEYLRAELPHARIIDATLLIEDLRTIKSPEEIAMLKQAGDLARKMVDTLVQSAEPGRKECELFADMVHTQIANGGEANIFIFLSSGPVDALDSNRQLLHGAQPFASPTTRTLEKGDIVVTEFHSNWAGYLAAVEFTLYLGKAPDELKKVHEVCVKCLERLKETMRPGVTFREVLEAERGPCLQSGMDFVELGFHGHGLTSPEVPTAVTHPDAPWGAGESILDMRVQENMVFGTNIDIHDPGWKKDIGVMLGDTLHITENGARPLVNIPLDVIEKVSPV